MWHAPKGRTNHLKQKWTGMALTKNTSKIESNENTSVTDIALLLEAEKPSLKQDVHTERPTGIIAHVCRENS